MFLRIKVFNKTLFKLKRNKSIILHKNISVYCLWSRNSLIILRSYSCGEPWQREARKTDRMRGRRRVPACGPENAGRQMRRMARGPGRLLGRTVARPPFQRSPDGTEAWATLSRARFRGKRSGPSRHKKPCRATGARRPGDVDRPEGPSRGFPPPPQCTVRVEAVASSIGGSGRNPIMRKEKL